MNKLAAKRLSFPKKRDDIERIVEEVESVHEHEEHHHHHHHHHNDIEDAIVGIQMLVDSLSARVSSLETKISDQGLEVARLYKVLSHMIEALMAEADSDKREALIKALRALER